MRLLAIFGTRPELIKLAPVLRALRSSPAEFDLRICTTAQHRDLVDPLLQLFEIKPDIDLDVMRTNQSPTDVIRDVIAGLAPVLAAERPDGVIVQGDTASTAAAAVAARYADVRIAHVEAGLRTGRLDQPFPEEANRRLVGAIADLHFAPTERAREHLLSEGVPDERVVVTGNTGIDALHWALSQPAPALVDRILLQGAPCDVILATVHRRETFGVPLEEICLALRDLSERYGPAVRIVCPVHPNPQVSSTVHRVLGSIDNVSLIPPADYLTLVHLMKRARVVLTDSGGLQEEAPSLGKPVLVLRDITERPEGIEAGTARLVGTSRATIVNETSRLLEDDDAYAQMSRVVDSYGDGHASSRIVEALRRTWTAASTPTHSGWLAALMLMAALSAAACGKSPDSQSSSAPPPSASSTAKPPSASSASTPKVGDEFDLHVGGAVTLAGERLTVTVEKVSDDSRCPAGAQCVWAGDAIVHVVLVTATGQRSSVQLHAGKPDAAAAAFRSYLIRLVRLAPAKPAQGDVSQDSYVATLAVSATRG